MSLLPQTIPSPSAPLARVWKDGKPTDDVTIIEENFWLFLYNLSQNVLGGGSNSGLPAVALIDLASTDSDVNDSDAIVLRQPIRNLNLEFGGLGEPEIDAFALRSPLSRALLLAQDGLLPDPPAAAQPVQVITVGGSPFSYSAPFNGSVAVTAGTVSAIVIIRQGTTVATGLTVGVFPLSRGDILKVTFSGTPTMTFLPT